MARLLLVLDFVSTRGDEMAAFLHMILPAHRFWYAQLELMAFT